MNANVNIDASADMGREPNPAANAVSTTMSAKIRPFYWSLRREVWENRSIYIAPIAVAALVLVSALINVLRIPEGAIPTQRLIELSPDYVRIGSVGLFAMVWAVLGITTGIVGWFYCVDALYNERRERSVLFWKSMPVSDATTVLSKLVVGIGVVPLIAFLVGLALYVALLAIAAIVLISNGVDPGLLFSNTAFGETFLVNVYGSIVAILFSAPLYAWAIFVSSWVRRSPFLWAVLPPAGVCLAELLAFGTSRFASMLGDRFFGGLEYAFITPVGMEGDEFRMEPGSFPDSLLSLLDPMRFLSQPALWIGLVVSAGFIAASIWMRRYREPL